MALELFAHPFSSYSQKVLIALWSDETAFDYRVLGEDDPNTAVELKRHWPFGQFPLLLDDGRPVVEATCIIDHLQARHPGPNRWIPDGEAGRRVRFLDRVFDLRIMEKMQVSVFNAMRPPNERSPSTVAASIEQLHIAYDWLDANLGDGPWAIGETFTLADCAAAPSLFYADWVEPIGPSRPRLAAYRARLLAHPPVKRAVDEGRPYRSYFPLGAPDRD